MMVTLEEIRLRLAEPPEADNELLADLAERAVAYMEQQTHQSFATAAEVTETVRNGFLSGVPVGDVTLEYRTHFGGTWTAVDVDDFEVDGREIRTGYPFGLYELRATYTRGGTEGLQPADVRGAVLDLVALWYEAGGAAVVDASVQETPHSVQAVINSRRRMWA